MPRRAMGIFLLASFVGVGALAGPPRTITVIGQDNALVDRQAIQDALDGATPGSTVELVGTFQLDGERVFITGSHVTITGRAVDDDGDRRVNEDWENGADDDGDGLVDEDGWNTVVRGLADVGGAPAGDPDLFTPFNRGFVINGVPDTVRNVTIRHLEFDTHHRAVGLTPDSDSPTFLCDDYFATEGSAQGVVVERNRFVNNRRAVQSFGEVRGFRVRDNVFENNLDFGVLLVSEAVGCFLPDGSPGPGFSIGTSHEARVEGNRLVGTGSVAVLPILGSRSAITGNAVKGGLFGIDLFEERGSRVVGNVILGTEFAFVGEGVSPGSRFVHNLSSDVQIGYFLLTGAQDYVVANNEAVGSRGVDVLLDSSTTGNTVIATDFELSVVDEGADNVLVGTLARDHNPAAEVFERRLSGGSGSGWPPLP